MAKVLIVEDDRYLSHAYKIKLVANGFEVQLAGDGDEALKTLQSFTPDIILLDLMMPVKDGFTTLKEIRAMDQWKTVPIIVTSNLSQKEDVDRVKALGATDYMVKSDLTLKNLMQKIHEILGDAAGGAPAAVDVPKEA